MILQVKKYIYDYTVDDSTKVYVNVYSLADDVKETKKEELGKSNALNDIEDADNTFKAEKTFYNDYDRKGRVIYEKSVLVGSEDASGATKKEHQFVDYHCQVLQL